MAADANGRMTDTLKRLETIIAARRTGDPSVLLADAGLSFDDVFAELDARDGVSGLAEKAARKDS